MSTYKRVQAWAHEWEWCCPKDSEKTLVGDLAPSILQFAAYRSCLHLNSPLLVLAAVCNPLTGGQF